MVLTSALNVSFRNFVTYLLKRKVRTIIRILSPLQKMTEIDEAIGSFAAELMEVVVQKFSKDEN